MAPLQHARATVIKLHGDYPDVEAMRNTPAELAIYDPAATRADEDKDTPVSSGESTTIRTRFTGTPFSAALGCGA